MHRLLIAVASMFLWISAYGAETVAGLAEKYEG
jgi:hypothetical protein